MEDSCVHHVEFCVRDGETLQRTFLQQYKFSLAATRVTKLLKQWVLKSGTATCLITQQISSENNQSQDQYFVESEKNFDCKERQQTRKLDTVFNVALKVKNVASSVERLSRSGVKVLRPVEKYSDKFGEISIAVVKSCIGNVVHTLIQDDEYSGIFLPGFNPVDSVHNNVSSEETLAPTLVTHFDHVTFACNCGDTNHILEWYSKCFGMRRFMINSDEDSENGFVIDTEDIGVRLKAFEYWKCAETGLSLGSHPESIKFVIAEALPNQGPNQVDTFLHDHDGAGIQHVGLHTEDIVKTVSCLSENGVQFAEPPYTYYTEVGKYEEICDIGQDVDILRKNGILVDAEADPGETTDGSQSPNLRYLMQKFTKPLFDRNTFFLEIIQRVGARGFGSGNITALWRSVQAYLNNQEKSDAS
ncbi:4-hydroxyphenylpyruvate dioxygenase-like protein [Ruditapes philippinarum]|uniref:4-hydroxyphenylpyruvate dioxygenase-like protein n=1 Tax=Ruditapes philippinarum TaxID=129788 RepID=UPI00295A7A6D|nr:4-hydroxyphenylpyruvate dioxygenase-like protein [Ruditapes philippinarum]